jgi:hypothetical protein
MMEQNYTNISRTGVVCIMRLWNNDVVIDKIAQLFGHTDVTTTCVYLESFENKIIDEIVGVS